MAGALTLALTGSALTGAADAAEPLPGRTPLVEHADSVYPSVGSPGVDVRSYDLSLRWLPRARTLAGIARLRLRAENAGGFRLDLAARLAVGRVTVRRATTGRVLRSTYTHRGRHLSVSSPGLDAGTTYAVAVRYRGRPGPTTAPSSRGDMRGIGWHTTATGRVWSMQEPYGAFTWYPVNDHPSDKATYRVRLDVPRPWVGVSNGRMVSRRVVGARTVTRFVNRDPMASYLTTVAIGPYRRVRQTGPHGLPLTYWVPRAHPEYLTALRRTPSLLRWLERRLGRYPFDRAGVVVTPTASAMETQTMITLGAQNFGFGPRQVQETVLHELAHSWYGDTVTPDDWSDLWMNEGMAMYLQARFSTARGWHRWSFWRGQFIRDDALWRALFGPPGDYRPRQFAQVNVYYCSARMLIRLRNRLGPATFDSLVRRWPQEHRNSVQNRTSYVAWLAARTGEDASSLRAFFDTWLTSRRSPP